MKGTLLVLGVMIQRAGGEVRISKEERADFDQTLEVEGIDDPESGDLIVRLVRVEPHIPGVLKDWR